MTPPGCIVVVARPTLGRKIEAPLRAAGHEVHRTPDPRNLPSLAARLRPHLIIVELKLPWGDERTGFNLRDSSQMRIPLLLVGDGKPHSRGVGLPILPASADDAMLLAMVEGLLVPVEQTPDLPR